MKNEVMVLDSQVFSSLIGKKTSNDSLFSRQTQDGQILSDLQQQTLLRIFCVCPRPSSTVINMISTEMSLPKDIVFNFFAQQKTQESTLQDTMQNIIMKKKEKKTATL